MKEYIVKWTKGGTIFDDVLHDANKHNVKLRIAKLGGKVLSIEENSKDKP